MRAKLILFLMVATAGCGQPNLNNETFSGTLEMTEHQLGAKAGGRVSTLSVEEGGMVKAGQVIATLDRYEQTKKDLERTKLIFAQGGANQQAYEYAQLAMEDQAVIAPLDGIVLVKVREVGESASAGAPVVVIGDLKDQYVKIFVPEGLINQIHLGQNALILFDGLSKQYKGHVMYIATKAEFTPRNVQTAEERVTQAFGVKVAIDDPDMRAHPGVAADVKFQ